jgi:hypothetical protein
MIKGGLGRKLLIIYIMHSGKRNSLKSSNSSVKSIIQVLDSRTWEKKRKISRKQKGLNQRQGNKLN